MREIRDRIVFTVARHDGYWAVEQDGDFSDHSIDKEEAKAAQDKGQPCLVRVSGEHGFFATA